MSPTLESVSAGLLDGYPLAGDTLYLGLSECRLRLRSNSTALIEQLRDYFAHVVTPPSEADLDIIAIECPATDLGLEFVDWKREPGKTGRKDAYLDFPGGRLVQKVRTGMLFLQSEQQRIAAGPCLEYDNQVINFINAQYMNWLQNRDWLICHASGLVYRGHGFAMAGFSGGGKSTIMLKLLDHADVAYLTNDRLFVRRDDGRTRALGIPKLPRINPGTIVHNPRLQDLIEPARRAELLALPPEELWDIEDKYDVRVEQVYGAGSIVEEAPLEAFLVLNWHRSSDAPLRVEQVNLDERRELLGAIMKSPGPFYQYPDGRFHQDDAGFDEQAYLDTLADVRVYEASGGVDFPRLTDYCLNELLAPGIGD